MERLRAEEEELLSIIALQLKSKAFINPSYRYLGPNPMQNDKAVLHRIKTDLGMNLFTKIKNKIKSLKPG